MAESKAGDTINAMSVNYDVSIDETLNSDSTYEGQVRRVEYKCLRQMSDFNNVFKAFIGTAYLSFPFGFLQSGLILGAIVLTFVVGITGHCCHLIVDVKTYILKQKCGIEDSADAEDDPEYQRLARTLRFNDIGLICLGRVGPYLVDFFLVFTQVGFCVAYFIFIGNAIHDIMPPEAVNSNDTEPVMWPEVDIGVSESLSSLTTTVGESLRDVEIPTAESLLSNFTSVMDDGNYTTSNETASTPIPTTTESPANLTTMTSPANLTTTASPANLTTTTSLANLTTSLPGVPFANISSVVFVNPMPDLKYMVLVPLLPFILFGFIRDMRAMGPWSLLANLAIVAGYFTILTLMLIDFRVNPGIDYFNWKKVPVFFGQVTCAFEGIGLVLPVEASMRDNAHNFRSYLNSTLTMVTCILASFGLIGYLRYGPDVQQVITMNIPNHGIVPLTLSCTLILAVTLTFPLQVFPVIEIMERYVFGLGKQDMSTAAERDDQDDPDDYFEESVGIDNEGLDTMDESDDQDTSKSFREFQDESQQEQLLTEGKKVADWKRNILRTIIILVISGIAVLLRDNFAYVSALIGAMGSTALGYVMPCLFHLKLRHHEVAWYVKVKDVFIIAFGVVGGVMGVIVVVGDIIDSFS